MVACLQQAVGEIAILVVFICSKPLGNGSGSNLGICFFWGLGGFARVLFP